MSLIDIEQLSLGEKVQLMEQLWDSLKVEVSEADSPSWHQDILKERKKLFSEGKVECYTIDEVKQKLG